MKITTTTKKNANTRASRENEELFYLKRRDEKKTAKIEMQMIQTGKTITTAAVVARLMMKRSKRIKSKTTSCNVYDDALPICGNKNIQQQHQQQIKTRQKNIHTHTQQQKK